MKEINLKEAINDYKILAPIYEAYYKTASDPHASKEEEARRWRMYKDCRNEFADKTSHLTAAIKAVEGRSTERLLTVSDICAKCLEVEERLRVPKQSLEGVTFTRDINAQDFPRAYKYTPYSTVFTCEYKNGKWRLINVNRERTHTSKRGTEITLPEETRAVIIDNVCVY